MVVNGKDEASLVAKLQQENRKLRSELEEQYRQAIKLAETIQMVHIARLKEAAKELHPKLTPASPPEDFQRDLDSTSTGLEAQQQDILHSKQPFAAQAEQLRTLEDRARKWAKKYLHKIKAAASKAEAAAGIPSPAPASGAGATTASPAGSQSVLDQRSANIQPEPASASTSTRISERTPSKTLRNGESSEVRPRTAGRQPMAGRPVSRSVSRTPESSRGGSRSRLMDPIGGRANGRLSEPPRRSASRPAESTARSMSNTSEFGRRSASRPAETNRAFRTTDSVRRSISRPIEGTIRSQSRPAENRPARSVNRSAADSARRSVSSRPAESTRSVSTVRSGPRAGSSTATSSFRATASPAGDGPTRRATQRASDTGKVGPARPKSGVARPTSGPRRGGPHPDPQPRRPDAESTEPLPDTSSLREAQEREAREREAQQQEAEQREAELQEAQRREAQQQAEQREQERLQAERLEAEQREAEQREAERHEAQLREAQQREAQQREAEQREAQQREAHRRAAQQREEAALRAQQGSPEPRYANGHAPASNDVPDLAASNDALNSVRSPSSPSTPPHIASPARKPTGTPAADVVAEALQGSQMDSATIIESVGGDRRMGGAMSTMSEAYPPSSLGANIRTNQMYQSIDVNDSVAEELLSATYASDTASMMSTMTGHEKAWPGAPPPKKKGVRTTFLNRLFSSKKSHG